jgi:hypothetical protein
MDMDTGKILKKKSKSSNSSEVDMESQNLASSRNTKKTVNSKNVDEISFVMLKN